jgi:hypothetical protein
MRRTPLLRLQALLLLALTGALASGVPSHHHERPDDGPEFVDAGHHGHGTQLVEQGDRQTSELVAVALPTPGTLEIREDEPTLVSVAVPVSRPLALGQPPPAVRPRAPPVSV